MGTSMYQANARYYDLIYVDKSYREEIEFLHDLIMKKKKSNGVDLLEVACGTGNHLAFLKEKFNCTGVDLNQEMLDIAREKHGNVDFYQGDMVNFNLNRQFDIILCLFSSIGYVRTLANLKKTINNFSRHLKKGGILIIEPWFDSSNLRNHYPHLSTHEEEGLVVSRVGYTKRVRNTSVVDFHWAIAEKGQGLNSFQEQHILGIFEIKETLAIMGAAGLTSKHLSEGSGNRGIYIGVKK